MGLTDEAALRYSRGMKNRPPRGDAPDADPATTPAADVSPWTAVGSRPSIWMAGRSVVMAACSSWVSSSSVGGRQLMTLRRGAGEETRIQIYIRVGNP